METPRFLADAMLGRLARYLRFVGVDTEYVRDLPDAAIAARARAEGRVVLTRDRALAQRAPGALWIRSPSVAEQWREVRAAWPGVGDRVSFDRCALCNGPLRPYRLGSAPDRETDLPRDRAAGGLAVWECGDCGHLYWEGSHTANIRRRLAAWTAPEAT